MGYKQDEFIIKRLYIHYVNEAGIDAGGLIREWFSLIFKDILNPDFGLF